MLKHDVLIAKIGSGFVDLIFTMPDGATQQVRAVAGSRMAFEIQINQKPKKPPFNPRMN